MEIFVILKQNKKKWSNIITPVDVLLIGKLVDKVREIDASSGEIILRRSRREEAEVFVGSKI
jgi:hypothetical protein